MPKSLHFPDSLLPAKYVYIKLELAVPITGTYKIGMDSTVISPDHNIFDGLNLKYPLCFNASYNISSNRFILQWQN